jgi:hypothetical protein
MDLAVGQDRGAKAEPILLFGTFQNFSEQRDQLARVGRLLITATRGIGSALEKLTGQPAAQALQANGEDRNVGTCRRLYRDVRSHRAAGVFVHAVSEQQDRPVEGRHFARPLDRFVESIVQRRSARPTEAVHDLEHRLMVGGGSMLQPIIDRVGSYGHLEGDQADFITRLHLLDERASRRASIHDRSAPHGSGCVDSQYDVGRQVVVEHSLQAGGAERHRAVVLEDLERVRRQVGDHPTKRVTHDNAESNLRVVGYIRAVDVHRQPAGRLLGIHGRNGQAAEQQYDEQP